MADSKNSFRAVAEEWLEKKRLMWTDHVERVCTWLERDANPALGDRIIASITPADMLAVVKAVEDRGAPDVAARVAQRCANVFRHGVLTLRCTTNPAAELRGVVKQRKVVHRAALKRDEIPEFLDKLDKYDGRPETRLAMVLLMHTFVRTGELRGARWSEIDFDRAEWRIPAERMKMGEAHVSTRVVALRRELRSFTSWSPLLFPCTSEGSQPISENTILFAMYRMGYRKKATGHGFRALASTSLNEMGWNPDVIERQLAAVSRGRKVSVDVVRKGMGQGRVLGADQAKAEKMVDGIMPFSALVSRLVRTPASSRKAERFSRIEARRREL